MKFNQRFYVNIRHIHSADLHRPAHVHTKITVPTRAIHLHGADNDSATLQQQCADKIHCPSLHLLLLAFKRRASIIALNQKFTFHLLTLGRYERARERSYSGAREIARSRDRIGSLIFNCQRYARRIQSATNNLSGWRYYAGDPA